MKFTHNKNNKWQEEFELLFTREITCVAIGKKQFSYKRLLARPDDVKKYFEKVIEQVEKEAYERGYERGCEKSYISSLPLDNLPEMKRRYQLDLLYNLKKMSVYFGGGGNFADIIYTSLVDKLIKQLEEEK
jgi:hypothetical protein